MRVAAGPAGEFGHHAAGFHAGGEHVAVVAVGGDDLIPLPERHLHADDDGFLADIQMAEAADEAHAVKLAGFFFETADQQHVAIAAQQFILGQAGLIAAQPSVLGGGCAGLSALLGVCRLRHTIAPPKPGSA